MTALDRPKSGEIAAAMPDFERLLDDLTVIADWKDELAAKIKRAQLRFELVELDYGEVEDLAAEVQTFNRLCFALGNSMRRAA